MDRTTELALEGLLNTINNLLKVINTHTERIKNLEKEVTELKLQNKQ